MSTFTRRSTPPRIKPFVWTVLVGVDALVHEVESSSFPDELWTRRLLGLDADIPILIGSR